jgi:hypothetical protein
MLPEWKLHHAISSPNLYFLLLVRKITLLLMYWWFLNIHLAYRKCIISPCFPPQVQGFLSQSFRVTHYPAGLLNFVCKPLAGCVTLCIFVIPDLMQCLVCCNSEEKEMSKWINSWMTPMLLNPTELLYSWKLNWANSLSTHSTLPKLLSCILLYYNLVVFLFNEMAFLKVIKNTICMLLSSRRLFGDKSWGRRINWMS